MMRYLRGKSFLDVLGDGIQWLVPSRAGKVLAIVIVLMFTATLIYMRNYHAIAKCSRHGTQ